MKVLKSLQPRRVVRAVVSLICLTLIMPFFQNCSGGFKSKSTDLYSTAGESSEILNGKAIYQQKCAACHGAIESSTKLGRSANQISAAVQNISQMSMFAGSLSAEDMNLIAKALNANAPAQGVKFACVDPNDTGVSQILRLDKDQYINSLTDIFGTAIVNSLAVQLGGLSNDDTRIGSIAMTTITDDQISAYMDVAMAIAQAVTASDSQTSNVFGACALATTPTSACVDTYLTGKAVKILRRPLTSDEMTEARTVVNGSGTYRSNLAKILASHLQSPSFLLRMELGTGNEDTPVFNLTPYEVASRISYATTDSTPDDTLLAAAKNNKLVSTADIDAQVRRLFATARGKAKIHSMFRNWLLQLAGVDTAGLPAGLTAGIELKGLSDAIMSETDQFIDYIVFEKNLGYKDLLTSKVSFASHAGLASIYGHAPLNGSYVPGAQTAQFDGRRQGLLMRASYLVAPKSRTNLVSRGVRFRRQVMCQDLPDPDAAAVAARNTLEPTEAEAQLLTSRQYITQMTNSAVCLSCHSKINPTGFAFENFDPLGRIRTSEQIYNSSGTYLRSLAVDSSAAVPTFDDQTLNVPDAYDLVSQVAGSQDGPACFARQTLRYFNQRQEGQKDACVLNSIFSNLTKANASIMDAFVASVANSVTGVRRKGN